jgi:hypothetical protein
LTISAARAPLFNPLCPPILGDTPKPPAEGESLCTPLSLSASLQVLDFTGMTCIKTYSTMADVYVIILANCVGKYSNLKGGKRCSSAR